MGYGVPAAVAAKLLHPERIVVAMAGDGDFLMTGQELATAVQYEAAIVVLVVNNGMYGTIRMHQERHYPGRVSGTDLVNPDFAALARRSARTAPWSSGRRTSRTPSTRRWPRAARRDRAARRPRGVDAEAVALGDSRAGAWRGSPHRRIGTTGSRNPTDKELPDGKVVRKHGDQGVARRGLGARPRLQRPRDVAQRPRVRE